MAAGTWLEILPVFSVGADVLWLRPYGEASWRVPGAWCPVRQTVLRSLVVGRLEAIVVHSTSWRQEAGAVVLTHLAVVRPPVPAPADLHAWPAARRSLARGTSTRPPRRVDVEQVLEHALRHLAWLAGDDPEVGAALDGHWHALLGGYRPEPFRVFEREPGIAPPPPGVDGPIARPPAGA